MKHLLIILVFGIFSSCAKEEEAKLDVFFYKGRCDLKDLSNEVNVCILYEAAYSGNIVDNCYDEYVNYNASSHDLVQGQYESPCSAHDNVAGKCTFSDKVMYFYLSKFTAPEAQSECLSLGGKAM